MEARAAERAVRDLREAVGNVFGPDTAWDPAAYRGGADGHCAAVSAIVWALLGGELVSTARERVSHWHNRLPVRREDGQTDFVDVDLTGDQFGHAAVRVSVGRHLYDDGRARTGADLADETLVRASLLAKRAGLLEAVALLNVERDRRRSP